MPNSFPYLRQNVEEHLFCGGDKIQNAVLVAIEKVVGDGATAAAQTEKLQTD